MEYYVLGRERGGVFRNKEYLQIESTSEYTMVKDTQEATIFTNEQDADHIRGILEFKGEQHLQILQI